MKKEVTIQFDNAKASEPQKAILDGDFSGGGGAELVKIDLSVKNDNWKYLEWNSDEEFVPTEFDQDFGYALCHRSNALPYTKKLAIVIDEDTYKKLVDACVFEVKMTNSLQPTYTIRETMLRGMSVEIKNDDMPNIRYTMYGRTNPIIETVYNQEFENDLINPSLLLMDQGYEDKSQSYLLMNFMLGD